MTDMTGITDTSRPPRISRRQALRITAATGITLALGGGLRELIRTGGLQRVRRTELRMGTPVTLIAVHPDGDEARRWITSAFAEMERLESILSRHREGTPVARLNRSGFLREAPDELLDVVRAGLALSRRSGGAFDMTVAPLLALHRSRFSDTGKPPEEDEVARALERVGYERLHVEGATLSFERAGMALTLDGIAKGYVVDRTVACLGRAGAEHVLVEAGGDMAATGTSAPGAPWRVGIQHPERPGEPLGILEVRRGGIATSGDYIHSFTPDRMHHHILDPRTGWSPREARSVTVTTPSALEADALSTAVFVLGAEEGRALLESLDGVEGLIVTRDGREVRTRGFPRQFA
jgi:FAD:protein FMN transferase